MKECNVMNSTRPRIALVVPKQLRKQAKELEEWISYAGPQFKLIQELVGLMAALTYERMRTRRTDTRDHLAFAEEVDRQLGRIRKRYPSQLKVVTSDNWRVAPLFAEMPLRPRLENGMAGEEEAAEVYQMLNVCESLAKAGAFAAVTRCKLDVCNRLFFRSRLNKRYCSDDCQRRAYERSPRRQESNKKFALEYYYRGHPFAKPRSPSGRVARLTPLAVAARKKAG
jgi:hypothetical protein